MAIRAGHICGNALRGLDERFVIEAKQVYDGCVTRLRESTIMLKLTRPAEAGSRFISAQTDRAEFERYIMRQSATNEDLYKIEGEFVMYWQVTFESVGGQIVTIPTEPYSHHKQAELCVPKNRAYRLEAQTRTAVLSGTFINEDTVAINCCSEEFLKVVITADVLVPSYGYCRYPFCEETLCDFILDNEV